MKKFRYRFLTAIILLCIGSNIALTAWAKPMIEASPESVMQDESAEDRSIHNESPASDAEENGLAESAVQSMEKTDTDTVYADSSNFWDALWNCGGGRIVLLESVVCDTESADFLAETPMEIVLGEYCINVEENSRLTFSGPFHFTGAKTLFHIGGELFFDGVRITASGDETAAITFADAPVAEGKFTMDLGLFDAVFSVQGTGAVGIRMAQGANLRMMNTAVTCDGDKSTGIIEVSGSSASIYQQSRFEVTGDGASGMIVSESTASQGLLDFDVTLAGDNSRGMVVPDGGVYTNKGTVTVSGTKAVGIELKEDARSMEAGAVIVSHAEGIGILAAGNLEAIRFSLKAETGIAAEAEGSLTFILCDIDTPPGGLLSRSGELVLDTCRMTETPDGAVIKTRKAQPFLSGYQTLGGEYLFYDVGAFGFSAPVGADRLTLPDTLAFSLYDGEDFAAKTIELPLSVTWEQADYDPNRIGDYEIRYRADTDGLPMEITGMVTVHVYGGTQPRLVYAVRMGDQHTELHFAPRAEDTQKIRLWVSTDDGETWRDYIAEEQAQAWGSLGFVATDALEENTAYLLKLELVGETGAGMSPVLSYFRSEREIRWNNGDRDGGDQRPQEDRPDPVPTPKPSRPASSGSHSGPGKITVLPTESLRPKEPEAEPVFAQNSPEDTPPENSIELTQPELVDLAQANPETITVVSDGIKADLPTEALQAIPLAPDESLTVVLEQPEEGSFGIRLYAGKRDISLGGAPIDVTVPTASSAVQAVPQAGGTPIPAEKSDNGLATFCIPKTGTYAMDMLPTEEKSTQTSEKTSWIWLSGVLIFSVLLLIVWLILRKRRSGI